MHIAYSPYFHKIYKFPSQEKLALNDIRLLDVDVPRAADCCPPARLPQWPLHYSLYCLKQTQNNKNIMHTVEKMPTVI